MEEYFEKAMQKMKSLNEIVSEKEWNEIAKKENLLSARSIVYISNEDFIRLQEELRAS